jgi:GT2 family glycosyltransferase
LAIVHAAPSPLPLVSIMMPTRDGFEMLSRACRGVLEQTSYPRIELIIVDNQSRELRTLEYLRELTHRDSRVRVLRDDAPFNFSGVNNAAARIAKGEVLCLLNNDVEITDPNWLDWMVRQAVRPGVGAVGAKLKYPDGTIQHCGVVLGQGGIAGHAYVGACDGDHDDLSLVHRAGAVTAACLVTTAEAYAKAGGMNERLAVAFNDVDFCMRLARLGLRNLVEPRAVMIHHESKTRGADVDPRNRARFREEVRLMLELWKDRLVDPWHSPRDLRRVAMRVHSRSGARHAA